MTHRRTSASPRKAFKALGDFMKKVTHEVPTGPHTDVRKRKLNPSFKKRMKKVEDSRPPRVSKRLRDQR